MPKSAHAKRLDRVQDQVSTYLRAQGFRKRGRVHNRPADDGIVHVVGFQMGEFPVGQHYVVPGLRENRWGSFAVNLGVFLPCIGRVEHGDQAPSFITDARCTIRRRLFQPASNSGDWFDLSPEPEDTAETVTILLREAERHFFQGFSCYRDVLEHFDRHDSLPFQNRGRSSLEAAIIAHETGQRSAAKRYFSMAIVTDHPGFRAHVARIADLLGYER